MRQELTILDIADVHQQALAYSLDSTGDQTKDQRVWQRSREFFLESLSTFEMAQRGFYEAQQTARLQHQHTRQLRALTDAALAINSQHSLDEVLQIVCDKAREITDADQSTITLNAQDSWPPGSKLRVTSTTSSANTNLAVESNFADLIRQRGGPLRLTRQQVLTNPVWESLDLWGSSNEAHSLLGAPLSGWSAKELGVIELCARPSQDFTDNDQAILEQIAQMASVAIENVRLYEQEHRIAESLQRSLLPERLPMIPGIALAARFDAGGLGVHVGGDWYDVIHLPNGRLGLAIGDVAGRGIRAAAVMGQLKVALRSYALEGYSPKKVVEHLNTLVNTLETDMATLVYLVLEPDMTTMRIVNAGHPPVLVRDQGNEIHYLNNSSSIPLGALEPGYFQESRVELKPGSTLVLYTDGLIETRNTSLDEGFARLASATSQAPHDVEELCDHVKQAVFGQHGRTDDVAILALKRLTPTGTRLHMDVQARSTQLLSVRRQLAHWLGSVGASPDDISDLVLACSEACANVITHGSKTSMASFEIDAALVGSEVTLTVRDSGSWRPPRESDQGRGLTLMRALTTKLEIVKTPVGTEVRMHRCLTADGKERSKIPARGLRQVN
jgi:serine phosphatase RsbU (regulator of sigma subunit)/anti-sigma regulatory factor (Ser/Thr protein kinase)